MHDNARYLFNVHHRTLYIWLNVNIQSMCPLPILWKYPLSLLNTNRVDNIIHYLRNKSTAQDLMSLKGWQLSFAANLINLFLSGKLAINETGVNVSIYNRDDLWRMRADALRGIIPIGNRWQEEMGEKKKPIDWRDNRLAQYFGRDEAILSMLIFIGKGR